MALLQHIDFEVPAFGEFASASPGTTLSQSPAAGFPEVLGPDGEPHGLQCLVSAGSTGYVRTRNFAATDEIAVGLWLYVPSGMTVDGYIYLWRQLSGNRPVLMLMAVGNTWRLRLYDTAGNTFGSAVPVDRWCYVAVCLKMRGGGAGERKLWLDGVINIDVTGLNSADTVSNFDIGPSSTSGNPTQHLYLDQIKIGTGYADVQPTAVAPPADWPCPGRTLIVARAGDADSEACAQHYAAARGIPLANICRVPCSANETLAGYATFQSELETPLADWLALNDAVGSQITTIVLGYHVPGAFTDAGLDWSAGSRLARLGQARAPVANPLYDERAEAIARVTPAELAGSARYLVHRVDGPTLADAVALVDRAVALDAATLTGEGFLDPYGLQGGGYEAYENLLEDWGRSLTCQRLKQTIRRTAEADPGSNVAFDELADDDWYFGWLSTTGSADFFGDAGPGRRALFYDADSYAMATLRSTATGRWCPLALAAGYALTAGPTDEPTVAGLLSPWPLFEALRRGWTWAEAFARANPKLDAFMTAAGDPLATVRFPVAGCHVYRGPNAAIAIDYDTLIAAAPVDATAVQLPPADWSAAATWFLALRTVDGDGVEYADPTAIVAMSVDASGHVLPPAPAGVKDLAVAPTAAQRLTIRWRYVTAALAGGSEPSSFEVFVGPASGQTLAQLLAEPPAATVPFDASGSYEWTTAPMPVGIAWRIAVHALSADGPVGPASQAVAFAQASRARPVAALIGSAR